ncbi:MAG TPA: glycosyltransferase family 2 protein [Pirellulales bacterium]|jgi:glycosyltransferase involved in cell wall biosynthesis|nr:glycosyltransferase family 2 protein [Pirellulales bacterium]
MTYEIDVSVVICTYNRAEMLRGALASLLGLETDASWRYEVIVVDNASTDATVEVVADVAREAKVPFRGVYEPKPGVACARNRGVAEARGRYVAFFDDDQVADPNWLRELLEMVRKEKARCVGGAVHLLLPTTAPPLPEICRRLLGEAIGADKPVKYSRKMFPGTGNMLVERTVFDEVGTFNESLRQAGEDSDLFLRMLQAGITGWYAPLAIVRHVIPEYRVRETYFRWVFRRNGWTTAERDRTHRGVFMLIAILGARLMQAMGVNLWRMLFARLRGDRAAELGWRCLLWRAEGYMRCALRYLAPRLCAQKVYREYLEFRGERQLLGGNAAAESLSRA